MPAEADHEARFKLAEALARNPGNKSAAARAAGYNRRQVNRCLQEPEFVKMLEAAKARLADGPGPIVSDEDGRAAKVYLLKVVEGAEEGDQHRVNAAKALLAATTGGSRRPPQQAPKPTEEAQGQVQKPSGQVVDLSKWRKNA